MINGIPYRVIVTLTALLAATAGAAADPPPGSCQQGDCDLQSDLLLFAEGDPLYEVVAHITECGSCSKPDVDGKFHLVGTALVTFGPYSNDPNMACAVGQDELNLDLDTYLVPGAGTGGGEATYVPADPSEEFVPKQYSDLRTDCVDLENLEYHIPKLTLTGAEGAESDQTERAFLLLPDNVRSTSGHRLEFDPFRFTQGLTFTIKEGYDSSSTFAYWPEGLPFRIRPNTVDYDEHDVAIQTRAQTGEGPDPYVVEPPDPSNLDPSQLVDCTDPEAGVLCTTTPVWNGGYFDSPDWTPQDVGFARGGFDVALDLPSGSEVVYQPLFPQGTTLRLTGPARLDVRKSRIADGGRFTGGQAWLKTVNRGACQDPTLERRFDLTDGSAGTLSPRVTPDGGILAGIETLNIPDTGGAHKPLPIVWTFNRASLLGCGTFFAPPPLNATLENDQLVGPQREWVRAAESTPSLTLDPVQGRGVYAGVNYNRNRVCSGGSSDGRFCGDDADCPGGGTCVADRWSPMCAAQDLAFLPRWTTEFQKNAADPSWAPLIFEIDPRQKEQEMAFFLRASGMTGVFDAGLTDITSGEGSADEFDFHYDSFGHSFRASHAEWGDSIIKGGLILDWPSDTTVPFAAMHMCDCGGAGSASTGEPPVENKLAYWDAKFSPYSLIFADDPNADCTVPEQTTCAQGQQLSQLVCIEAMTPIPHFAPDPISVIDVAPDGNPGQIKPLTVAAMDFEPNSLGLKPYSYDVESFDLNDWEQAGSPARCQVLQCQEQPPPSKPFGYYDGGGEMAMPYFGLTGAGLQVRRHAYDVETYDVDMHQPGDPETTESYIELQRKIAGDAVELAFRADYFRPSATADPNDGTDEDGRGLILGYSGLVDNKRNLNLGSIHVPTGLIISPDGPSILSDVGPAASMRLWGATTGGGRDQLSTVLPPNNLNYGANYDAALAALGGDPWNLPPPEVLYQQLYDTGAISQFENHPDWHRLYNTSALDPGIHASSLSGYLAYSSDLSMVDLAFVDANLDTGGEFFAFDRSNLSVDRHVKSDNNNDQPISQFSRKQEQNNMELPGQMSIAFPDVPGMQWDFDYKVTLNPPSFEFISLTGSLDLTQGGLSSIGFDKAGMTLKFWNDGDWYFQAGLALRFSGYQAYGDILLGNCKDMTPLQALDPAVADFLSGINTFRGGYARVGVGASLFDFGCFFRLSAGLEVGGWYITDNFGAKLRAWIAGQAVCLLSVRGDLTLIGGEVGDKFRMQGSMWVAGGLGFCEPDTWDTIQDVFDDGWCMACVLSGTVTGETPPKLKMDMEGPDVECSL